MLMIAICGEKGGYAIVVYSETAKEEQEFPWISKMQRNDEDYQVYCPKNDSSTRLCQIRGIIEGFGMAAYPSVAH